MSSLTHTQVRSIIAGDAPYRVQDTVSAAVGMSTAVFLFRVADDVFDHVCTLSNLDAYPDTKNQAITDGKSYYRGAAVTLDFAELQQGVDAGEMLISRMKELVVDYTQAAALFVGTTTETLSG